jgi:signal transduction histidine kinase
MDTLVNFKEKDMISMASVICSTLLMRLSIEEREILGSRNVYIKSLLNIVDSYSYYDLIENTLSALVNLLIDSSKNCKIFVELKGFDVLFSLLEVKLNQWSKK